MSINKVRQEGRFIEMLNDDELVARAGTHFSIAYFIDFYGLSADGVTVDGLDEDMAAMWEMVEKLNQ